MHCSPLSPRLKFALIAVLLFGLFLRAPFIRAGLPYFYDEDEAHHFNRVVNMVKRGTYDPEYFHKPSLHFYLRMPVVGASFLQAVREGELRTLSDIITKDPYGVGDYSFSASHPKIVKWNRAFSVLLSLGCVLLVFSIARLLTSSDRVAIASALLTALSPALVSSSAVIGVDVVMGFFCLLAVYLGLKTLHYPSRTLLAFTGLAAGLAISSKYNALPIAMVPLITAIRFPSGKFLHALSAIGWVALGFILGSPFILAHPNLFLDQFAYEIWHYGIAGHEGHSGEPGLSQAKFFINWLMSEGLSLPLLLLSLLGFIALGWKSDRGHRLVIAFPLLYFLLMSDQRANFTRNILVLIPFAALFAVVGLNAILHRLRAAPSTLLFWTPFVLLCITPLWHTKELRGEAGRITESRIEAENWLRANPVAPRITAVSGTLQFQPGIYPALNAQRIDASKFNATEAGAQGITRVIVSASEAPAFEKLSGFEPERRFEGNSETQRVVQNPAIHVFRAK